MDFELIDPTKIFQVNGVASILMSAQLQGIVASDQQVVAAISGKRIRLMGWLAQSQAATPGSFLFKNGSGGGGFMAPQFAPQNTNGLVDRQPITNSGYFETTTGIGLYVDIVAQPVNVTVFYIIYTPAP